MHILIVSHYAPPYSGGIQVVVGELAAAYMALGHRVTVLASSVGQHPDAQHPDAQRPYAFVGVPAWNGLEERVGVPFPIFEPFALRAALWRLFSAPDSVEAVHVHGMLYLSSAAAAWMAQRRGLPVVLTEHVGMVEYHRWSLNALQRIAVATIGRFTCWNSRAVVVLNSRVSAEVAPLLRQGQTPLKIPNGVDARRFRPFSPTDRAEQRAHWAFTRRTALFVGRLVSKKGAELVVAAANDHPAVDYVLCGKDTERLDRAAPNVRGLGAVPQSDLPGLYNAADALVLLSESEGFPLVVQEAMACGLPVIVTDNAVNREYLDESVAIFCPRQHDALRTALDALFMDEERRAQMGMAARQWAVRSFDWHATAQHYLALLGR